MLREFHVRKDTKTVLPGHSHPSVKCRVELVRQVRPGVGWGGCAYRLPTARLPEHCAVWPEYVRRWWTAQYIISTPHWSWSLLCISALVVKFSHTYHCAALGLAYWSQEQNKTQ